MSFRAKYFNQRNLDRAQDQIQFESERVIEIIGELENTFEQVRSELSQADFTPQTRQVEDAQTRLFLEKLRALLDAQVTGIAGTVTTASQLSGVLGSILTSIRNLYRQIRELLSSLETAIETLLRRSERITNEVIDEIEGVADEIKPTVNDIEQLLSDFDTSLLTEYQNTFSYVHRQYMVFSEWEEFYKAQIRAGIPEFKRGT